jgi:tRNA threonylcarbamoyladenosine biosynthesis protein TsaB
MKMDTPAMNLLAFDTGTEAMSIAVARTVGGVSQQWQHSGAGGPLTSTGLIPAILDLLQQAGLQLRDLDAICFGSGPGSFTGLRTACSVAQGLAFGAQVPVLAIDSLLAVAEAARFSALADQPRGVVTALLDARMDEWYGATFAFEGTAWTTLQDSCLLRPQDLAAWAEVPSSVPTAKPLATPTTPSAATPIAAPTAMGNTTPWALAGNVFATDADRLLDTAAAGVPRIAALPCAQAMLRLAPALLAAGLAVSAEHAMPRYIRDKVAKTTAERAAEKAAALQAAVPTIPMPPMTP